MRSSRCVIGLALVAACGGGSDGGSPTLPPPPPPPLPNAVTVTTFGVEGGVPTFSPVSAKLAAGGTVTWRINPASPVDHTVTSNTEAWQSSGNLGAGDTFSVTFPTAGLFQYRCTIHPGMNGQITVEG